MVLSQRFDSEKVVLTSQTHVTCEFESNRYKRMIKSSTRFFYERPIQSNDLKMLQHRGYTENCQETDLRVVMLHYPTFPDFKDFNVLA